MDITGEAVIIAIFMDIYSALFRWNLWGSWQTPLSKRRAITDEVCQYIATEEIIALIGLRRVGKSTILYQVMDSLIAEEISPNAILHINFEEPELSSGLSLSLLDKIYDNYRARVYPKGKAYIFLDEIQNIPEWERWVRARNDTEDIKIFLTGSSSALLSSELASVLTGRNFAFNIYPLSFKEVLEFKQISLPDTIYPDKASAQIQHALLQYLEWGGFPRVVLANSDAERERLLQRYFDEIILKDVVQRHEIRDAMALRNLAIHLLTNTATLISYKRLGEIFQVSAELVQKYIYYLQEACLINTLQIYSLKAAERTRNPYKVHVSDLGMRKVVSMSLSPDYSKLIETQVHNQLLTGQQQELFYWKNNRHEIDLIIQQGIVTKDLIQVAYTGLNSPQVLQREISSLQAGLKQYPNGHALIITLELPDNSVADQYENIQIVPLWHFLLNTH